MIYNNAICFFRDGNQWCCAFGDFDNLRVSVAGFGSTFADALKDLDHNFSSDFGPKREALTKAQLND